MRRRKKYNKLRLYLEWGFIVFLILMLSLMGYFVYTLIANGSFSLEWAGKKAVQKGEEYSGFELIGEEKGVVYINHNCTTDNKVFKGIVDCTGKYALFFERTEEGWKEREKKVVW